jgi:hypothetical protein
MYMAVLKDFTNLNNILGSLGLGAQVLFNPT